jgi:formate dehydrogenase iron-sulfur subunit
VILSSVPALEETPIDRWLAQQADLTAVERFAQRHEADALPAQARYYRDLIPLARPEAGQQYGFEVDLDACTGCKACVAACHSLNGLDDGESWRSVSVLHGTDVARPSQQTVTAGCHHCVDPACLSGCPVDAYEKDPVTGIVVHLDDQCIGCSYCTLTCPYEVPVYNRRRGIVRKCDMCRDRLADGEAPACVQACPNQAIRIAITDVAHLREAAVNSRVVSGAPRSSITTPSTSYRTVRPQWHETFAGAVAHDRRPASQTPLAVMLVLTQLSVGTFVAAIALGTLGARPSAIVALASGVVAMAASVFHLGRPRYAYRAVIGFRHSWLSREILAFGGFTTLVAAFAVTGAGLLGWAAAAAGLAGVGCSVMIYARANRSWWRAHLSGSTFALSAAATGLATVACIAALASGGRAGAGVRLAAAVVLATKLLAERSVLASPVVDRDLGAAPRRRVALGVVGGAVMLAAAAGSGWIAGVLTSVACIAIVAGELIERSLFFTNAPAPA